MTTKGTTDEVTQVIGQLRVSCNKLSEFALAKDNANTLQREEEANLAQVLRDLRIQIAALEITLIETDSDIDEQREILNNARFSMSLVADFLGH